ncbi:MAG: flagellin [Alphaproteobacteria bacterium]|nr:flagellin [Alphaproteobacteria bacterium]
MLTVNTNMSAMIALQNLNKTNAALGEVQTRINTGLAVTGAKDDGAIYAIAQNQRGDVAALGAVSQSIDRAVSTVDVALAAGEAISDLLIEMKEKAVAAADASLDTASRDALNEDFIALRDQITTIVENAEFNGINLVDGSTSTIDVLANADATSSISVVAQNLSLSSGIVTLASTAAIDTQAKASTAIATVETSLQNLNEALAKLGTTAKKLEVHNSFISKLSDSLTAGIGNLVDADLAVESARLQALQVKQQLGIQALGIANQQPQIVLSLFG